MTDEIKDNKTTRREWLLGVAGAVATGAGGYSIYRYIIGKSAPPPAQHQYDLSAYQGTQGARVLYEEDLSRRIDVPMKEPRAIAVGGKDGICVVGDKEYRVWGGIPQQTQFSQPPMAIAVAPDGQRIVAFRDLVAFRDDTAIPIMTEQRAQETKNTRFAAIAVSGDNVFVADAGNRVILRYDRSGKLINEIGRKDPAKGCEGLVVPSAYLPLAVTSDGLLRVANPGRHRVEAYTFDGRFELSWGEYGTDIDKFCGCCNPIGMAVLSGDRFATAEKGITRIKIFGSDGTFQGIVAAPNQFAEHNRLCAASNAGCTYGGLALAGGPDDTLYVLDPCTRQVRVFVPQASEANHG